MIKKLFLVALLFPFFCQAQLIFVYGCMFSGKTKYLIDFYNKHQAQPILVCKHAFDTRRHDSLSSRATTQEVSALSISSPEQLERVYRFFNIILIDEIQFFDKKMALLLERISHEGKTVIASGLHTDFRGELFGSCVKKLLKSSDHRQKLYAICSTCHSHRADCTQRLIAGTPTRINDPLVVIDDGTSEVTYEPRCTFCYRAPI